MVYIQVSFFNHLIPIVFAWYHHFFFLLFLNGLSTRVFLKEWSRKLSAFSLLVISVQNNILAPLSFRGLLCPLSSQTIVSVESHLFFCRLESAGNSIVRQRNRDRMVTMALCKISALTHRRVGHTAVKRTSDCGF